MQGDDGEVEGKRYPPERMKGPELSVFLRPQGRERAWEHEEGRRLLFLVRTAAQKRVQGN